MILVDANILIYAYEASLPQHAGARAWLADRFRGTARVGLPWASLFAFVRIVSHPRLFRNPVSVDKAWALVETWLDLEVVWSPSPTERHAQIVGPLLCLPSMSSRLVPDAHLAALAIEHGLTLCSADGDFARFPGLQWMNPVAAGRR